MGVNMYIKPFRCFEGGRGVVQYIFKQKYRLVLSRVCILNTIKMLSMSIKNIGYSLFKNIGCALSSVMLSCFDYLSYIQNLSSGINMIHTSYFSWALIPLCRIQELLLQLNWGQSGAAVTRPHGNHQDVGSNPASARNEKRILGGPPTEGSPMVQQDLNGRPAM